MKAIKKYQVWDKKNKERAFSVSFGTTWTDEHCKTLKAATRLFELGFPKAAMQRLCKDPEIRQAFIDSGEFNCQPVKQ